MIIRSRERNKRIIRRMLAVILTAMLLAPAMDLAASCVSYAADERPGYTITVVGEDNSVTNLTDVADGEVPLAMPPEDAGRGVLNLVLMLFTCALALMILLPQLRSGSKERQGGAERDPVSIAVSVLIAVLAAVSVAAFFLTEDLGAKAAMTDRNTALMGEIFLVELMVSLYARTVGQD